MRYRNKARGLGLVGAAIAMIGLSSLISCMTASDLSVYLASIPVSNIDFSRIPDGSYSGSYTVKLPAGASAAHPSVSVTARIVSGKAQAIEIVDPASFMDSSDWQSLISRVLDAQSLQVDAVSGASVSSKAFFKAVETAIAPPIQAKR